MKEFMCILLASILFTCCTEYSEVDGDLESKLSRLEAGNALFSYVFNGHQPGGLSVGAMIYGFDHGNACTFFATEGEMAPGPSSFTSIHLDINRAAVGSFEIVPSMSDCDGWADTRLLATARLTTVEDWKSASWVGAVSGSVEVTAVPETVPDWNAGVRLEGSLSISFPVDFMRTKGCTTVGGPDYWQETCTCIDDEGNTSECENLNPGDDCCQWMSEERIIYQAGFTFEQCPELCGELACGGTYSIPYTCGDLN